MNPLSLFQVERVGSTLVATLSKLPESHLTGDEFLEEDRAQITGPLDAHLARNILVDCRNIGACCSSTVAIFFKLWKRVQDCDGRIAFCNVADHLVEEFEIFGLDRLATFFRSRAEAIADLER